MGRRCGALNGCQQTAKWVVEISRGRYRLYLCDEHAEDFVEKTPIGEYKERIQ